MNIPGFRSGVLWKKIIASIYYLWIALLIGILFVNTFVSHHQDPYKILNPIIFWLLVGKITVYFINRKNKTRENNNTNDNHINRRQRNDL